MATAAPDSTVGVGWGAVLFDPSWLHSQTADFTLYAVWEAVPFTVTFVLEDGSTYETQQTETGDVLEYPPPPTREGYVFDGWSTVEPSATSGFPVRFSPPVAPAGARLMSASVASEDPGLVWPHNRRSAFTLYALWRTATSPRNAWFYPGAAPSNVFDVIVSDAELQPAFPRSTESYTVTARIAVPVGIGQLDTVTMCWYKSDAVGDPDDGVSDSCANAATNPETEFEVVWEQLSGEFTKTGSNNYQMQDGSDFSDAEFTVVEVYFVFKVSNAMRAGNWTVKVTALDVSGEVRSESEYATVYTFVEMQSGTGRAQQAFGALAEGASSTISDIAVGSYSANTTADFTIRADDFTASGRTVGVKTTAGNPAAGEVALDCNIGDTLAVSPPRVTKTNTDMSANLTPTGEPRNTTQRMSCRLTYGSGAPLALLNYSNTVHFTIAAR